MKGTAFTIAPWRAQHMPELTDLWVAAWTQAMPQINFEARRPWLGDHLDALHMRDYVTRCALAPDGSLAGFMTLHPQSGELDQIAVAPLHARCGVGRMLIAEARQLAPGRITLSVNQANVAARRFYAREGFIVTGEGVNALSGLATLRMLWARSAPNLLQSPHDHSEPPPALARKARG